ncbi:FAD-dependent oxidoreductase [Nocardioidaceae bacterium]|nr:FAD-dependent oxidoreductase [Nocardioidaceae bacterium]
MTYAPEVHPVTRPAPGPTRVVVVGAGMVGHRVVEELLRRHEDGSTGGASGPSGLAVHWVGAEAYGAYNRILLSEVLAGRHDLAALELPRLTDPRLTTHLGVPVRRLDRTGRRVELADGRRLAYDHLVLATGADAVVPPIPGLTAGLPRHAHVLRGVDDARDVLARSLSARHAVVLGGGLLGLEAATALRCRGLDVTLLQLDDRLAGAQLEERPAALLADTLRDQGIDVRCGDGISEVLSDDGVLRGVRTRGGDVLDCDLLLLSVGARARVELAETAGLPTDRGITVDADLRSPADARVRAVGDCAAPPEGGTGLLGPGWAQASWLAGDLLAPGTERPTVGNGSGAPSRPLTRLKAAGVDLVVMGVRSDADRPDAAGGPDVPGPRTRVVTVDDPHARRSVSLVLAEGRLVGVTALGAPDLSSSLSVAWERRTPAPLDPLALLLPETADEEGNPALMPGDVAVCRCNGVAKRDVVAAWDAGADSVEDVAVATRATTGCGGCRSLVCGLVDWLREVDPHDAAGAPGRGTGTSQPRSATGEHPVPSPQHEGTAPVTSGSYGA